MARTKVASVPEVGQRAPEFHLPSAQGGQLRLSLRTARGPVVVVFYRPWAEEDVEYFKELAKKEEEINLAAATVVGIGIAEPDAAREFLKSAGVKSYVLYDYSQVATREWGLLEKDADHGEHSRPAVFIVGPEGNIRNAWVGERPSAQQLYDLVHEMTGLPKPPPAEDEEKPKKKAAPTKKAGGEEESSSSGEEKPAARQKLSPEEREKRKAERKAAREAKAEEDKGEQKEQGSAGKEDAEPASSEKNEQETQQGSGGDGTEPEEKRD